MTTKIAPFPILALSVVILQYHSMKFWTLAVTAAPPAWDLFMFLRPWDGWGIAVALELCALWGWSQSGRGWAVLAVTASLLLVSGPLYQVSDPLVRELAGAVQTEIHTGPRITNRRAEISGLEQDARIFRRQGATGNLRKTRLEIRTARNNLDGLLLQGETRQRAASLDWRRMLMIGLELTMLTLLQVFAALAVISLKPLKLVKPVEISVSPIEIQRNREDLLSAIQGRFKEMLADGKQQVDIGKTYGLGGALITRILSGGAAVGDGKLMGVAKRMGV